MVAILMISTKLVTPGLLEIKEFLNKGYDIIISHHDATSKLLSPDSNYIVDMVI